MPDGRMRKERRSPGETGSWPYGASSGTGLRTERQPQAKTKTQRHPDRVEAGAGRRERKRKEMPGPSAKPQGELKPGATNRLQIRPAYRGSGSTTESNRRGDGLRIY